MVPPVKPAAPPVRTSTASAASPGAAGPLARPSPFKALLMMGPAPKALPAHRGARVAPDSPKLGQTSPAHHARPGAENDKPIAGATAKALAVDDEKPKAKPKPGAAEKDADLLDPSARLAAQLAPPMASAPATATEQVTQRTRVSLEELVPQVLRRIAWGGDRTKGSVHLELTTGDKVTVHAEGRRVRIEVDGNADLERRLGSRLRAAGIEVESVR